MDMVYTMPHVVQRILRTISAPAVSAEGPDEKRYTCPMLNDSIAHVRHLGGATEALWPAPCLLHRSTAGFALGYSMVAGDYAAGSGQVVSTREGSKRWRLLRTVTSASHPTTHEVSLPPFLREGPCGTASLGQGGLLCHVRRTNLRRGRSCSRPRPQWLSMVGQASSAFLRFTGPATAWIHTFDIAGFALCHHVSLFGLDNLIGQQALSVSIR